MFGVSAKKHFGKLVGWVQTASYVVDRRTAEKAHLFKGRMKDGRFALSLNQAVGLDQTELKPLEKEATARILRSNPYIRASFPLLKRKPTPF